MQRTITIPVYFKGSCWKVIHSVQNLSSLQKTQEDALQITETCALKLPWMTHGENAFSSDCFIPALRL